MLRLTEYRSSLHLQGYHTLQTIAQITIEDLEDVGIFKLGHQKRFLLGLKRMKELRSSAWNNPDHGSNRQSQPAAWNGSLGKAASVAAMPPPSPSISFYQPDVVRIGPASTSSSSSSRPAPPPRLIQHQPQQHHQPLQHYQQQYQHPVQAAASLEQLPPPPPSLLHHHVQPHHHHLQSRGSFDDSYMMSNSMMMSSVPSAASTFVVNTSSAHQFGTLPRTFKHSGRHHYNSNNNNINNNNTTSASALLESTACKPIAKVPAYPRPPQMANQGQEAFQEQNDTEIEKQKVIFVNNILGF